MENLLAFIEVSQFQQYLVRELDVTSMVKLLTFPENIPKSIILQKKQSDDSMDDVKIKAHRIYQKYVAIGSEFEINIGAESRNDARNVLQDFNLLFDNKSVTAKDLFDIFEKCRWELWQLLLGSYFRFRKQPEYHEFDLIQVDGHSPTMEMCSSQSEINVSP